MFKLSKNGLINKKNVWRFYSGCVNAEHMPEHEETLRLQSSFLTHSKLFRFVVWHQAFRFLSGQKFVWQFGLWNILLFLIISRIYITRVYHLQRDQQRPLLHPQHFPLQITGFSSENIILWIGAFSQVKIKTLHLLD